MRRTETDYKIIQKIKDAMMTKLIHDRTENPTSPKSIIGKNIIIPNDLRSFEDLKEDLRYQELREDKYNNLETVFKVWFSILNEFEEIVIKSKSMPMATFKDVSNYLFEKGISKRHLSDRYLRNIFNRSIKKIAKRFF